MRRPHCCCLTASAARDEGVGPAATPCGGRTAAAARGPIGASPRTDCTALTMHAAPYRRIEHCVHRGRRITFRATTLLATACREAVRPPQGVAAGPTPPSRAAAALSGSSSAAASYGGGRAHELVPVPSPVWNPIASNWQHGSVAAGPAASRHGGSFCGSYPHRHYFLAAPLLLCLLSIHPAALLSFLSVCVCVCCSHTHAHGPALTSLFFLHNESSTTLCWTATPESITGRLAHDRWLLHVRRQTATLLLLVWALGGRASTRRGWLGSQQSASPPPPTSPGEEPLCASEPPPRAGQPEGRESPHGTQLKRPALELAASGNLSVGLVLLRLEHPLLAAVHLLAVPVRQALMLILGSLSVSCLLQDEEDEWGSRSWATAAELTEGECARPAHMAPPPRLRSCSSSRPGSVPPAPFMCSPPSSYARSDRERRSSIQAKKISNCFFFNSPRTAG
ncbi:uncharacterized protein LOC119315492 [Triticum dicoccoides]|uniref:uncharacterized protein LOC119315492 n=1 Tax=Triticum dicoccoides TaxID=85692 RepID=UPI001890E535|nr:uncharacterized protein LOC119315492 [Triticum dicoccoides]